ncbi:MAG: acyl-CoA reductase [Myxococcota bacterium]
MRLLALADLDRGPGRRLLEATVAMGFSAPVARAGLRAETDAWRAPGALDAVLSELPPDLPESRLPRTVLVLAAGTLPASAMRSTLLARLLGARVLVKPATGQEALAEALAAADPAVEARPFPSSDRTALRAAIAEADAVVVLGSDATVEAVRAETPADRAFVGYGHRLSVACLREVDDPALGGLARDLCAWDQAGCLSPQVAWVEGDPAEVAPRLADAVREVERDLPMSLPREAARDRLAARTLGEMTGAAIETDTALLVALPDSAFRPSPGLRTLWLLRADPDALRPIAPHLSTIGYAGRKGGAPTPDRVRVCDLGEMQRPPLAWLHDGRPNLLPMLKPAREG